MERSAFKASVAALQELRKESDMKNKTRVLYDNTDLTVLYQDARDYLFDTYGEERGWTSIEDVPGTEVYEEASFISEIEWKDFYCALEHIFESDCYLICGVCGRWDGPAEGGRFIHSAKELMHCLRHLDYIKFYDENGHLKISGYHHDGADSYEVKRLTEKGYELAYRNDFACDRELHKAIFGCNVYSCLPKLALRLYGG